MGKNVPKVTWWAGPMKSGKTTHLYGKMGELQHLGVPFAAYKPGVDVRDTAIAPRGYAANGDSAESNCTVVESLADIPVEALALRGITRIFLEEASMFSYDSHGRPIPNLYINTMRRWAAAGIKRVYMAGLDLAANGNQFPLFQEAHRWGAKIVLCKAACEAEKNGSGIKCAESARVTRIRSIEDGRIYDPSTLPDLLPEGAPELQDLRFEPVCPDHLSVPQEEMRPFIVAASVA